MNWGYARSWTASLGWGDWPAWLACLAAVIALVISIRAQRDGRRSANAAEKSVGAAEVSVEEARLSRLASERSATVAEETLADQRREAAERRAAEEEASRPRVDLPDRRSWLCGGKVTRTVIISNRRITGMSAAAIAELIAEGRAVTEVYFE